MSTIQEVRAAEAKMKSVLDALKTAKAEEPNYLHTELECASDEYTKAVRECYGEWLLKNSFPRNWRKQNCARMLYERLSQFS